MAPVVRLRNIDRAEHFFKFGATMDAARACAPLRISQVRDV
jgi:hypothetical protein